MDWRMKAILYKLLSVTPFASSWYSFAQRYLTKSVKVTPERVLQKVDVAKEYWAILQRHMPDYRAGELVHVDLGAGWMPVIPFYFYSKGISSQVLLDVRYNLQRESVFETVRMFNLLVGQWSQGTEQRTLPSMARDERIDVYFSRLGIRYCAPYRLEDILSIRGQKVVTCTQVLMHILPDDLRTICAGIRKSLSVGGGLFVASVYLYDLFADSDPSIPKFNKFKYSDFMWDRIISSRFFRYNRLVAADYRRLLEDAGFEICEFNVSAPLQDDLHELRTMKLASRFRQIPVEQLAGRNLLWVVK